MDKPEKEKLSKPLLPLILLLMLVILITVIISNLRREPHRPLTNLEPLPETPSLQVQTGITDNAITEIISKEELIVLTAVKKYRLGELAEAENDFRTILVFDPNHQAALSYLGTIFYSQKKYRDAEMLFRRETEVYSGNPIAYRNLALALLHQGKFKDALDAMKKSAELSPENKEVLLALAKLYAYTGDVENTDKYLMQAREKGADISLILDEEVFRPLKLKLKDSR